MPMKTHWRYGILLILTIVTLWGLRSFLVKLDFIDHMDSVYVNTWCNMEKCFVMTHYCTKPYKHFVYPIKVLDPIRPLMSDGYRSILEILG